MGVCSFMWQGYTASEGFKQNEVNTFNPPKKIPNCLSAVTLVSYSRDCSGTGAARHAPQPRFTCSSPKSHIPCSTKTGFSLTNQNDNSVSTGWATCPFLLQLVQNHLGFYLVNRLKSQGDHKKARMKAKQQKAVAQSTLQSTVERGGLLKHQQTNTAVCVHKPLVKDKRQSIKTYFIVDRNSTT